MVHCSRCGRRVSTGGQFCPGCGITSGARTVRGDVRLPSYRSRQKRVVAMVRCGLFHHELLARMFHYNFCPECGQRLVAFSPQPQPI